MCAQLGRLHHRFPAVLQYMPHQPIHVSDVVRQQQRPIFFELRAFTLRNPARYTRRVPDRDLLRAVHYEACIGVSSVFERVPLVDDIETQYAVQPVIAYLLRRELVRAHVPMAVQVQQFDWRDATLTRSAAVSFEIDDVAHRAFSSR